MKGYSVQAHTKIIGKAQGAQGAQGAQQRPEEPRKPKLYGFPQVLGITVNNDVFEERIKQRKNT